MKIYHPDNHARLRIERVSLSSIKIIVEGKIMKSEEFEEKWDFEVSFSKLRRILNSLLKTEVKK